MYLAVSPRVYFFDLQVYEGLTLPPARLPTRVWEVIRTVAAPPSIVIFK